MRRCAVLLAALLVPLVADAANYCTVPSGWAPMMSGDAMTSRFPRLAWIDMGPLHNYNGWYCKNGAPSWCVSQLDTRAEAVEVLRDLAHLYPGSIVFENSNAGTTLPGQEDITNASYAYGYPAVRELIDDQTTEGVPEAARARVGFTNRLDLIFTQSGPGGTSNTNSFHQRCPHGTLSHMHETPDGEYCDWPKVTMCNAASGTKYRKWCRCDLRDQKTDPPVDGTCDTSLDEADCGTGGACEVVTVADLASTCIATWPETGPHPTLSQYLPAARDTLAEREGMFNGLCLNNNTLPLNASCDGHHDTGGTCGSAENCAVPTSGTPGLQPICNTGYTEVPPIGLEPMLDCSSNVPIAYSGGVGMGDRYTVATYNSVAETIQVTGSPAWGTDVHAGKTVYANPGSASWQSATVASNTPDTLTLSGDPNLSLQAKGQIVLSISDVNANIVDYHAASGFAWDLTEPVCRQFKAAWLFNLAYDALGDIPGHPVAFQIGNKTTEWTWQPANQMGFTGLATWDCDEPNGSYWGLIPWAAQPDFVGCPSIGGTVAPIYGPAEYDAAFEGMHDEMDWQLRNSAAAMWTDVWLTYLDISPLRGAGNGFALFGADAWENPCFRGSRSTYVAPSRYLQQDAPL